MSIRQLNAATNHDWQMRLYREKAAQMLLYGRALGLSHGEAEDVLHDVFAALLRMPEAPEEPAHYALRALRHRAMNYRRSLFRRLARELEAVRWFDSAPGHDAAEREAMRMLTRLPMEQREVIVLKIWHGHTFEEIGGLLEISPNTAAGRYRYGMTKLRQTLKGIEHELPEFDGDNAEPMAATEALRTH